MFLLTYDTRSLIPKGIRYSFRIQNYSRIQSLFFSSVQTVGSFQPFPLSARLRGTSRRVYAFFFGALSWVFLTFWSCFSVICFLLLSLSFLPLSPIVRSFPIEGHLSAGSNPGFVTYILTYPFHTAIDMSRPAFSSGKSFGVPGSRMSRKPLPFLH